MGLAVNQWLGWFDPSVRSQIRPPGAHYVAAWFDSMRGKSGSIPEGRNNQSPANSAVRVPACLVGSHRFDSDAGRQGVS